MIQPAGFCATRQRLPMPLKTVLVCSLFWLSACANMQPQSDSATSTGNARQSSVEAIKQQLNVSRSVSVAERTVLTDLAAVAKQIFDPYSTTLQINNFNTDAALQYFVNVLSEYGFGVQRVTADQGANFVLYTPEHGKSDTGRTLSASISIGAVEISRDYAIKRNNVVTPASVVRLSGTRVAVTVNDSPSARKTVADPSLSQAQYVASLSLDEQAPIIQLITPELVDRVVTRSAEGPSLQALNSSNLEVNNLFYGDSSTFSSVLDDYGSVDRMIIVFGNDSMVLGDTNKRLIDQFVDSTLKSDDLVSLVGCSNGPTALGIGNEGLALGRAKRVTQALQSRGVARDRILDEGCWAPVNASERFPSRGVVLELWRKKA